VTTPVQSEALPPSFPEHVRQLLETEIIEGRLSPGERVAEDQLARRLGVSRTPVREAMRVLEAQGLIVRRRGKGAYVAGRTSTAEARTLYDLRLPLEAFLAAQAAERITEPEVEELVRVCRDFRTAVTTENTQLSALIETDSELHWRIYDASGSELVSVVRSYWGRLLRELYARVYAGGPMEHFADQHDEIVAAIGARDPEAVAAAMKRHIDDGWEIVRASFESADDA
jgi:DNA-binding GntR family transcriptional regulator